MIRKTLPWIAASGLLTGALQASTVAYFRFEEATNGNVAASATGGDALYNDSVLDSSGNGNHFRTYWESSAPAYSTNVPVPVIPGTGAANTASLNFVSNDDIYPSSGTINTVDFNQFTIEAWVNFTALDGYQTLVGRDDQGNPGQAPSAESLFYLQKTDTNLFRVRAYDSTGTAADVVSTFQASVGTWYHVAAVADDTTLYLYVDGVFQGSTPFSQGLFNPDPDTIWTIGRGQYNGGNADFLRGYLDEVRFSDTALSPNQFLNVPEPGVAVLGALGLLGLVRRRR